MCLKAALIAFIGRARVYAVSNHSDLSLKTIESLKELKWLFWANMKRLNEVKNMGVVV
jgi:hypothetical protein